MLVALLSLTACRRDDGNVGYVERPQAENREEQERRWNMERNEDWNVVEDGNEIHTLAAVGSEFVTSDTRIAPVVDFPEPGGNELTRDQLELTFLNENDWDGLRAGGETVPNGFYEAVQVWQATHGAAAQVNVEVVPLWNQMNVLAAAVAAGESPDFMQMAENHFPVLPARGMLRSLLPYEQHLSLYYNTLYDRNAMAFFQWNSHYFGTIAVGCADEFTKYTIFDKALFDQYGEVTPFEHWQNGNWNWSQFVRTASAMTTEGRGFGFTGWGLFPYQAPYQIMEVVELVRDDVPFPERTRDEQNGWWQTEVQLTITAPEYITWLTEVYNLYIHEGAARNDWELQNWRTLLPRGNGDAMAFGSLAHLRSMVRTAQLRNFPSELRIAPVPVFNPVEGDDGVPRPFSYGLANAITARASSPVGAAEFIRLMTIIGLNQRAEGLDPTGQPDRLIDWLTDEEKEMIEWNRENAIIVMDPVKGVGDSFRIVGESITNHIHHGDGTLTVAALIDAARPLFQAEIDRFNAQTVRQDDNDEQQVAAPPEEDDDSASDNDSADDDE